MERISSICIDYHDFSLVYRSTITERIHIVAPFNSQPFVSSYGTPASLLTRDDAERNANECKFSLLNDIFKLQEKHDTEL